MCVSIKALGFLIKETTNKANWSIALQVQWPKEQDVCAFFLFELFQNN